MMWAISRTRSSRSIHDIHCRPLPIGPPSPNSNGSSSRLSIPPSMPSTRPMRNRTTRTPSRCAFLASRSQASQRRCEKQRLPPSNSVSVSSCHRPYQPIGGAADQHRGSLLQSRDQAHDGARHAQPRRQNLAPLAARPQAVADRFAGEIDHGIDPRVVRDLLEVRHDPKRRPQRRRLRRIAREHGDVVPGARERLDQAASDEAGPPVTSTCWRAGSASTSAVACAWACACRREQQMRGHDANSRYNAICRSISPKRGCVSCRVKLKRPSGTSAWITVSSPGQSHFGSTKRRPNICTK